MTLLEEIQLKCNPALIASRDTGAIAEVLNTSRTRIDPVEMYASLGISERFPEIEGLPGPLGAELVFRKLESFSTSTLASDDITLSLLGGAVIRQMGHLQRSGLAIGSPAVIAMLVAIVQVGGLTQVESDALISVAEVPDPITEFEVRKACWADNGDWLL